LLTADRVRIGQGLAAVREFGPAWVRIGSMLSKKSTVSEVGGFFDTRGQLLLTWFGGPLAVTVWLDT